MAPHPLQPIVEQRIAGPAARPAIHILLGRVYLLTASSLSATGDGFEAASGANLS
jgi:hypothetical protein